MTGLWKRALRALVTGDRAFIKKLLTYLFKVGQVTDLCHALEPAEVMRGMRATGDAKSC